MPTCDHLDEFPLTAPPADFEPVCADCVAVGGYWVHLRRCLQCQRVSCCDSSPAQHATAHFHATSHPIVASYEPGEAWMWNHATEEMGRGPALAEPTSRPEDQTVPGPQGRVPENWQELIHR